MKRGFFNIEKDKDKNRKVEVLTQSLSMKDIEKLKKRAMSCLSTYTSPAMIKIRAKDLEILCDTILNKEQ